MRQVLAGDVDYLESQLEALAEKVERLRQSLTVVCEAQSQLMRQVDGAGPHPERVLEILPDGSLKREAPKKSEGNCPRCDGKGFICSSCGRSILQCPEIGFKPDSKKKTMCIYCKGSGKTWVEVKP